MCCELLSNELPAPPGAPGEAAPEHASPDPSTPRRPAKSACWSGLLDRCELCGVAPGELPSQAYLSRLRRG